MLRGDQDATLSHPDRRATPLWRTAMGWLHAR